MNGVGEEKNGEEPENKKRRMARDGQRNIEEDRE